MAENSEAIHSLREPMPLPPNLPAYEQILLMDLIEHLHDPETFMDDVTERDRRPPAGGDHYFGQRGFLRHSHHAGAAASSTTAEKEFSGLAIGVCLPSNP